jgi:beta-aspartyl-peptidase (threonine type)
MKTLFVVASFFLVLASAAAQTDKQAIRSVLDDQVKAWNEGKIEEFMKGYWNSDETSFVSGGTITKGYAEVLARYKKGYDSREKMGILTFDDVQIRLMSPSSAVTTGIFRLQRANDKPWGRFTLIFEKKPEGWRIVYDHTSSASP